MFSIRFACLLALLCTSGLIYAFDVEDRKKRDDVLCDSVMSILDKQNTTVEKKKELINNISNLTEASQLKILLKIENEISESVDNSTLSDLYCNIASCYLLNHQIEQAKPYLDKAAKFEDELTDIGILGKYHHIWGNYYNLTAGGTKSHDHYYKAISYYEKLPDSKDKLIAVLNNLSFSYIQKDDVNNLKKIVDRMLSLVDEKQDPFVAVNAYRVAFYYYHSLDKKNEKAMVSDDIFYGDSTIFYNKKIIDLYEANNGIGFYPEEVAYDFVNMASICIYRVPPDHDKVISYIQKARSMANPQDTAMLVNLNLVEGFSYYKQKQFEKAEPMLIHLLEVLNHWSLEEDLDIYVSIYNALMNIALDWNDDNKVLDYERKKEEYKNKIHDKEKYQTIQDLQIKYEVGKKEQQIVSLLERNRYQEQIRLLFIGIIILGLISSFFVIRWYKTKKKEAELASQLEKEKAHILAIEIKEKDQEYQALVGEVQLRQIRSYLEGLEVERSRMAKDLHDNISNELVILKMRMDNNDVSKDVITSILENIHKQVRNISHGLMPPVFKYATLPDILEDFARQQNHVSGTTISFSVQSDERWDDFPSGVSLEIYRIIQEAVGNALKYADAQFIEILLMRKENHIRIIIEDDGKGFDVQTTHSGIGLRTIKERVESLKGNISIESVKDNGTEIVIDIDRFG